MNLRPERLLAVLALAAISCGAPRTAPLPAPVEEPQPLRATLLFTGDVMQHLPQVHAARRGDGFDYAPVFAAVRPHFEAADLTVVNLETTLASAPPYTGYPLFRSPAALADALAEAGVDAATLANNHCCDGGGAGIRTTIGELDRCGILHTGTFADSLDRAANHPLRIERCGIRFALLSYTYGTNGMSVPRGTEVNRIDTLRMAADLAEARRGDTDCVAVCIHWGNEYQRQPDAGQRRLADFLRRHGADLVIGHHPHVVQPCEADSTHAVCYSLGNFVSNQRQRYRDGGLMALIDVVRRPDGSMRYDLKTIPVWVSLPGYRILPPEAADSTSAACRRFLADTDSLLGKGLSINRMGL